MDECISREGILEKFSQWRDDLTRQMEDSIDYPSTRYGYKVCRTQLDDCINEIKDFPSADGRTRWISVEERLPEERRVVLLYRCSGGPVTLGFMTLLRMGDHSFPFWDCLKTPLGAYETPWVGAGNVKYWMPLPKPPGVEDRA